MVKKPPEGDKPRTA